MNCPWIDNLGTLDCEFCKKEKVNKESDPLQPSSGVSKNHRRIAVRIYNMIFMILVKLNLLINCFFS